MRIEDNLIFFDDKDLPYTDKMSKGEVYGKGMYDMAAAVKEKVDAARKEKQQHSYMYWGSIFEALLAELDHLTARVLESKRKD